VRTQRQDQLRLVVKRDDAEPIFLPDIDPERSMATVTSIGRRVVAGAGGASNSMSRFTVPSTSTATTFRSSLVCAFICGDLLGR